MPVSRIARSLAGALLVCGSALADDNPKPVVVTNTTTNPVPTTLQGPVTVQGTATVNVSNTAANPVPTTAQGTTQISGAVDVLSAPPVTGSVAVSNQPTVNLAAGSTVAVSGTVNVANQPTVNLAAGSSVGISGTPSVSITGTPTVGLAAGSSVAVSSLPAVQISGTPTVSVSGMQFDSSGNLKVTGTTAGATNSGRIITLVNPFGGHFVDIAAGGNFVSEVVDTSDCRSLTLFQSSTADVQSNPQFSLLSIIPFGGSNFSFSISVVTGTNLDSSPFHSGQVFLVPGTSAPVVTPNAKIFIQNVSSSIVTITMLGLYCSR